MAITLVGVLDTTTENKTIGYAYNIKDANFNHEGMVNIENDPDSNKQGSSSESKISINEYLYQRSYKPYYFTCGTAADTAAKSITGASGWGLSTDDLVKIWPLVRVKFTHGNSATSPTLNINNTGAKPIKYDGAELTANNAGILNGIVTLMYNGTTSGSEYWDFISGDVTKAATEVTAADDILHGSNVGSEITYAPYPSDTATSTWVGTDANGGKLYLGTQNPSKTNRLNFNGYLYAKKLYSEDTEVKVKQTSVSDPTADGNSTSFIATISQNANGEITVTKKNLGTATTTTVGGIKAGAVGGSAVSNASTTDTDTTKRYAVLLDSNGLAYTNVPWTDTDTTYTSGNEITIGTGNAINHDAKLGTTFTSHTAATTVSGFGGSGTIKVPVFNVNEYGHVTSASEVDLSITMPEAKIATYTAPTYPTNHISPTYQTIITNNAIAVNTTYDDAFKKLDTKLAGLTQELVDDESVFSQAMEDEPRYYAKSSTASATGTLTIAATLVESRNYYLFNGTNVNLYMQHAQHDATTAKLNVSGSNGASGEHYLVYEDALFKPSLINDGTVLDLVYDSATLTIDNVSYAGVYRVIGVAPDLQPIYDALASMETWPTVTETQNSITPTTLSVSTSSVPNSTNTYYKVGTTTLSSGAVVEAGSTLTLATDISVNTAASFTPSTNETYTAQNSITGMTYGYKNSLSDGSKQTGTSKSTSASVSPTFTRTDKSNTADTTLILYKKVNSGSYAEALSVNNSGGASSIKLTSGTSLGALVEGTTNLQLKYTNISTISRAAKSYSINAVNAFYSSNINNFNAGHEASVAAYSGSLAAAGPTYASSSSSGVKSGTVFTVYAVYYLKTNGSATSATAITGTARTAGTSGTTTNNFASLVNYAANTTSTYYVSFGLIKITDTSVQKSYVYTPNNVTLTSCQGANSSTGSYDSGTVNMVIELVGTETIDGVSYKKYWIKNPTGSTSEGANSYKLTIHA